MHPSLAIAVLTLSLAACNTNKFKYTPPEQLDALPSNARDVNANFDDTWSALISTIGQSFFAIDAFEKDSGLVTLTFNTSPFSTAVDGGHLTMKFSDAGSAFWRGHATTRRQFDGNYADFVENFYAGSFQGKCNLVVQELDENQTRITVNTRFDVQGVPADRRLRWSWSSGDRAEQMGTNEDGSPEKRIMQSTNYVEAKILDAIDQLFEVDQEVIPA